MSDTTTKLVEDISKVEWKKNAETGKMEKDAGAGVIVIRESFSKGRGDEESAMNGFLFSRIKCKTAQGWADHFTRLSKGGKSGDEIVCQMVDSAMSSRFRSQATQKFIQAAKKILGLDADDKFKSSDLSDEDIDNIRKEYNNILIDENAALEYIPGEREVSAISGFRKQKDELLKQIKALKEAGKTDLAKEKLVQFYEVDKQLKTAEASAEEELLNLLKD